MKGNWGYIILLIGTLFVFPKSSVAQNILDAKLSVDARDKSIKNILENIAETYQLQFYYSTNSIPLEQKVTIRMKDINLGILLTELLKNTGITYRLAGNKVVLTEFAERLVQTIRGRIIEKETMQPLMGVTVGVTSTSPMKGAMTDLDGYFRIEEVPIGRHDIKCTYIGYDVIQLHDIPVNSGKELVLELEMGEMVTALKEVTIKASNTNGLALNSMTTNSARSFDMEEAQRYAASVSDPSRMAQSYAGVAMGSDGLNNEISVRGNSPRGLLWRLEGIEIPNPNHFSNEGSSGGAISMLNSTTLATSDIFTGAFPAEYGNTLSGVIDLKMRNGNNEKREYTFKAGLMGLELGLEGPIQKGKKASYLFNYRYSTMGLLTELGLFDVTWGLPSYQDMSFKLNFPTEKLGRFGVFGLGGDNHIAENIYKDPEEYEDEWDRYHLDFNQSIGVVGLTHSYLIGKKSYVKSVLSASGTNYDVYSYRLDENNNWEPNTHDHEVYGQYALRWSSYFNHKINANNSFRIGGIVSELGYQLHHEIRYTNPIEYPYRFNDPAKQDSVVELLDANGKNYMYQGFAQYKKHIGKRFTVNAGLHAIYLKVNDDYNLEPRLGLKYKLSDTRTISLSYGLHTKAEPFSTLMLTRFDENGREEQPFRDLQMIRAHHYVLGYNQSIGKQWRFNSEVYYQELYNVPVENVKGSTFSILNGSNYYDIANRDSLVNEGTAKNIGMEVTFERHFGEMYYLLFTGSIIRSTYSTLFVRDFNSPFNDQAIINIVGGKEWSIAKRKGKDKLFGLNAKFLSMGGRWYTPLDYEASALMDYSVYDESKAFTMRGKPVYRLDLGFSYKVNRKKVTHKLALDLMNVTNHQSVYAVHYDRELNEMVEDLYYGFLPFFTYTIQR